MRKSNRLADKLGEVFDESDVDLRGRTESAQPGNLDLDAALDGGADLTLHGQTLAVGAFDLLDAVIAMTVLAAQKQHPGILVLAGDMRLDGVADGGLEMALRILEYGNLDTAFRFAAQIDEGELLADRHDDAPHLVSDGRLPGAELRMGLVELLEEVFEAGFGHDCEVPSSG